MSIFWVLYIEGLHHFHARIFYLLCTYRCVLQLYSAFFAQGAPLLAFVMVDAAMDAATLALYAHEYIRLQAISVFWSPFVAFHLICLLGVAPLILTQRHRWRRRAECFVDPV